VSAELTSLPARFPAWAQQDALPCSTRNHTFRATGITLYLGNGGTIENATPSRRTSLRLSPISASGPRMRST
jgi:hypothetical protein